MELIFPTIDPEKTGKNIERLRKERGLTVRDLQGWFNFEEPRAIYKWQSGQTLPNIDNLFALSALLGVSMNEILVSRTQKEQGTASDGGGPVFLCRWRGWRRTHSRRRIRLCAGRSTR